MTTFISDINDLVNAIKNEPAKVWRERINVFAKCAVEEMRTQYPVYGNNERALAAYILSRHVEARKVDYILGCETEPKSNLLSVTVLNEIQLSFLRISDKHAGKIHLFQFGWKRPDLERKFQTSMQADAIISKLVPHLDSLGNRIVDAIKENKVTVPINVPSGSNKPHRTTS